MGIEKKNENSIFTTNYQLNGDIAADLLHSNGNVGQTGIGVCLEVLKSVNAAINEEGNRMDVYLKQTNGFSGQPTFSPIWWKFSKYCIRFNDQDIHHHVWEMRCE